MRLEDKQLYKDIAKAAIILVATIFLCRVTKGYFSVVMAVLGIWWAFTNKFGLALSCYAFFPFLIILDQGVLPKTSILALMLRVAPLIIGLVLIIMANSRRGVNRLPFGSLFFYLLLAIISSMDGWAPMISYMKLINFVVFLIGIWLGTQNMQDRPRDMYIVRIFFLAIVCVLLFGNVLAIPFPAISYSTNFMWTGVQSQTEAAAAMAELAATGGVALFSGITNQSQALAPMLSCCVALVLSDMLFVAQRKMSLHVVLIVAGLIELYMTRSRTGLFSCAVGLAMVLMYAAKRMQLSASMKVRIRRMATTGIALLMVAGIASEITNRSITKWIYKANYASDMNGVGFEEALTSTRQVLIEQSLDEFRRNPLFGMGFQVNFESYELYGGKGFVLSAPVEKGLLPLVVLGEGGIVGSIAFIIFLFAFYTECAKRKLQVTIAMFTTFLATNIGEATFFSPGGIGGILWVFSVVGGFMIDSMILGAQHRMGYVCNDACIAYN